MVKEELPNGNILNWDAGSPHGRFWRDKYLASLGYCPHDMTPLKVEKKGILRREVVKTCPICNAKFDRVGVEIFGSTK